VAVILCCLFFCIQVWKQKLTYQWSVFMESYRSHNLGCRCG
jgi:hypothetical protein